MSEGHKQEAEAQDGGEEDNFTPPPREYETKRGRVFEFGKPALKHRNTITKVLRVMQAQKADYEEIIKCAKARGMTVEDFVKLNENELTDDEKRAITGSGDCLDVEFANAMNDILTECLYATIKKAPFQFETMEELERGMDDYTEAVELFPIAARWVSVAAREMGNMKRPN